ncbi:TPA: hypothetical protein ACPSKY_000604 [Legionella bozemanae]
MTEEDIAKAKEEANKQFEEDIARINKEENEKKRLESLDEARFQHQRQWAKVMDELRNSHKTINKRTGKETTYWDEIKELADEVINSEQTSINDWRSNMMSLLNLFAKLNKAINISANQVSGEAVDLIKQATNSDNTPILRAITHPNERIYEGVKSAILNKIKGNNDVKIDAFEHKVTFKDGKVDIAPLTRKDGIPFDKENEANKAFKKFVEIWLMENQYVPGPKKDGSYVRFPDGTPLDETEFNNLKKGFSKFLSETASFKFEEQEELEPGQSLTNN